MVELDDGIEDNDAKDAVAKRRKTADKGGGDKKAAASATSSTTPTLDSELRDLLVPIAV